MHGIPFLAGQFLLVMQNNHFTKITAFKLFGKFTLWAKEEAAAEKSYESEEIKIVTISDDYYKREFTDRK